MDLIFAVFAGVTLLAIVGGLSFFLGRLTAHIKEASNVSTIALIAATYAAGESHALKNAPVLRQVMERYVPVAKAEDDHAKMQEAMEAHGKEWEKIYGFGANGKVTERRVPTNGVAPEDAV